MKNSLFSFENVTFGYGPIPIFKDLTASAPKGEFILILGGNGEGKSTFCKLLLGQCIPQKGRISFLENPVGTKWQGGAVGYVPQLGSGKNIHFPINLYELISLNLRGTHQRPKKDEIKKKVADALAAVGLSGKENELFGNLSGGQRQKALLAKAMVHHPQVLLFDEPTIGIDKKSKTELYELMDHIHTSHHISIIMVSHEPEEVSRYVDRIFLVEGGNMTERWKK